MLCFYVYVLGLMYIHFGGLVYMFLCLFGGVCFVCVFCSGFCVVFTFVVLCICFVRSGKLFIV